MSGMMKTYFLVVLIMPMLVAWLPTTAEIVASRPVQAPRFAPQLVQQIKDISGNVLGIELEKLLVAGNLQEIIWRLQESEAADRATRLTNLLQHRLEYGAVRDISPIAAGMFGARLVEFEDGLRAVFKTVDTDFHSFRGELSSYVLDNIIDTHVFPLTTTRTIDGQEGSLQLFIENSLSGLDILSAKRAQLGLPNDADTLADQGALIDGITLPASPAVKTLQLLSLNLDLGNWGNHLLPQRGRQLAIDGGVAFSKTSHPLQTPKVEESIADLQANPTTYLLDPLIVAKMKTHLVSIEAMFPDDSAVSHLHETLAAYEEAVANREQFKGQESENALLASMVEALGAERWPDADRAVEKLVSLGIYSKHTAETELERVAREQRNWPLLDWLQRHNLLSYGGKAIFVYVLSVGDYELAARVSPPSAWKDLFILKPLYASLHDAIAKVQGDGVIDYDKVNWQEVGAMVEPVFRNPTKAVAKEILQHLHYAIDTNNLHAVDRILRCCIEAVDEAPEVSMKRFHRAFEHVVNDLQKFTWLSTHEVVETVKARLPDRPLKLYDYLLQQLFVSINRYIQSYALGTQETTVRERLITSISAYFITYNPPLHFYDFFEHFDLIFSNILDNQSNAPSANREASVQGMHKVLDILQAQLDRLDHDVEPDLAIATASIKAVRKQLPAR